MIQFMPFGMVFGRRGNCNSFALTIGKECEVYEFTRCNICRLQNCLNFIYIAKLFGILSSKDADLLFNIIKAMNEFHFEHTNK